MATARITRVPASATTVTELPFEQRPRRGKGVRLPMAAGDRFHRLVLLERVPSIDRKQKWLCVCDCGKQKATYAAFLARGAVKSCGCLNAELSVERLRKLNRTHGRSRVPEHRIWRTMHDRCYRPVATNYVNYGGRGIRVDASWHGEAGYERFIAHIGPRPSPKHSLDRINNNGHYEPGNVRWATREEQANNKRSTLRITAFGETLSVADWSRKLGLKRALIYQRVKRDGLSGESALSTDYLLGLTDERAQSTNVKGRTNAS